MFNLHAARGPDNFPSDPVLAVSNAVWLWDRFATSQTQGDVLKQARGYVPEAYCADDRITVTLWITNPVVT